MGGTGGGDAQASGHAPKTVQIMSKAFTVAGPKGFCVDDGATRETQEGAFVMLGSCAAISGNPKDAKPHQPALLTASVTPAGAPLDADALDRMTAYFASPEGRAALARSETSGEVTVLDLARDTGLVMVHARDGAKAGDVDGQYWRAVFEAAGHLVTITVSGYRTSPLGAEDGVRLAQEFVQAVRKANAGTNGGGQSADAKASGGGLASFFNRLL